MPTDPQRFHSELKEWSRWKHAILREYLKAMAAILRSRELIYYVDGFAGQGKYAHDKADGSALLAARHAKDLSFSGRSYALRCINVEHDAETFRKLQSSTAKYEQWVENFYGNFGENLPAILDRIGEQPTLFFLDPFGLKGLEWDTLLPIFERENITELLIRFDGVAARRHTGRDTSHHPTFNAILGVESSEYWQGFLSDCGRTSQDKQKCLLESYVKRLRKYLPLIATIPIRRSDDHVQYYLIFATRDLKGIKAMNDVMYKIEDLRDRTLDEERLKRNEPKQKDMFARSSQITLENDLLDLKNYVLEEMQGGDSHSREDLRAKIALLDDNLGRYSRSHFTAVLGGSPRGVQLPNEFQNLRSVIEIHNNRSPGDDKAIISLK